MNTRNFQFLVNFIYSRDNLYYYEESNGVWDI